MLVQPSRTSRSLETLPAAVGVAAGLPLEPDPLPRPADLQDDVRDRAGVPGDAVVQAASGGVRPHQRVRVQCGDHQQLALRRVQRGRFAEGVRPEQPQRLLGLGPGRRRRAPARRPPPGAGAAGPWSCRVLRPVRRSGRLVPAAAGRVRRPHGPPVPSPARPARSTRSTSGSHARPGSRAATPSSIRSRICSTLSVIRSRAKAAAVASSSRKPVGPSSWSATAARSILARSPIAAAGSPPSSRARARSTCASARQTSPSGSRAVVDRGALQHRARGHRVGARGADEAQQQGPRVEGAQHGVRIAVRIAARRAGSSTSRRAARAR